FVGDRADRHAGGCCRGVDLVVDVGDVARVDDGRIAPAQEVGEEPEHDVRPGVADVDVVVDGRSADVQRHAFRVGGYEVFDESGQAVVKAQGHSEGAGIVLVLRNSIAGGPRGSRGANGFSSTPGRP